MSGSGGDVVTVVVGPSVANTSNNTATRPSWPDRNLNGLRSSMYEGVLIHQRFGPGPTNSFKQKVAMPLLDLAEVDDVVSLHPAWSASRPAPVWFRRNDFLGDPTKPLDLSVRDLVAERTGQRPGGPIALLAHLRTWGWLFNPISLYFCADNAEPVGDSDSIGHMVAEVENTPWHDRHAYVVGSPGSHRFAKELHVSPFLPAGLDYQLRYTAPGERLTVGLDVLEGDRRLFAATLSLRRRALERAALARLVWSYPAMTHRVTAGIYAHAARLRLKGAPFFAHPGRESRHAGTAADSCRHVSERGGTEQ